MKMLEQQGEINELRPRAEQAEAEAARLRAGESDHPAAEGATRTPAEWIHQWNRATAEQRLNRVEQILADARTASHCQQTDHDGALRHLADTEQIIARIRHLADVYNHGANTSTDPAVRAWAASITDDLNIALDGALSGDQQ